jgi:predicted ATPase
MHNCRNAEHNDLLIIIADDLHVIDESSSHLLKHLIGKLETLLLC